MRVSEASLLCLLKPERSETLRRPSQAPRVTTRISSLSGHSFLDLDLELNPSSFAFIAGSRIQSARPKQALDHEQSAKIIPLLLRPFACFAIFCSNLLVSFCPFRYRRRTLRRR